MRWPQAPRMLPAISSLVEIDARRATQKAHDLLAEVYAWFTEGLDTVDLQETKGCGTSAHRGNHTTGATPRPNVHRRTRVHQDNTGVSRDAPKIGAGELAGRASEAAR